MRETVNPVIIAFLKCRPPSIMALLDKFAKTLFGMTSFARTRKGENRERPDCYQILIGFVLFITPLDPCRKKL